MKCVYISSLEKKSVWTFHLFEKYLCIEIKANARARDLKIIYLIKGLPYLKVMLYGKDCNR